MLQEMLMVNAMVLFNTHKIAYLQHQQFLNGISANERLFSAFKSKTGAYVKCGLCNKYN